MNFRAFLAVFLLVIVSETLAHRSHKSRSDSISAASAESAASPDSADSLDSPDSSESVDSDSSSSSEESLGPWATRTQTSFQCNSGNEVTYTRNLELLDVTETACESLDSTAVVFRSDDPALRDLDFTPALVLYDFQDNVQTVVLRIPKSPCFILSDFVDRTFVQLKAELDSRNGSTTATNSSFMYNASSPALTLEEAVIFLNESSEAIRLFCANRPIVILDIVFELPLDASARQVMTLDDAILLVFPPGHDDSSSNSSGGKSHGKKSRGGKRSGGKSSGGKSSGGKSSGSRSKKH